MSDLVDWVVKSKLILFTLVTQQPSDRKDFEEKNPFKQTSNFGSI